MPTWHDFRACVRTCAGIPCVGGLACVGGSVHLTAPEQTLPSLRSKGTQLLFLQQAALPLISTLIPSRTDNELPSPV
ncbi:hypothetical protein C0Q70_01744 [Pomacea canaliculata]|uniref:Uncharacterized protein n=1 Tax=Pomacea canaliculata TaxID=400727 RepID=A0A2T7Q0B1_POMCA|nr:hypothetical protein C0Q70_01744 [Pomacea canaliculata]